MTLYIVWLIFDCILVAFYCLSEKFNDKKSKSSFLNGLFTGAFAIFAIDWLSKILEKI